MTSSQATISTTMFSWTGREIELLLESIKSFKADTENEGIDWESVKTKYEKITVIFHENYPTNDDIENFPRAKEIDTLNKARITSKIKNIRSSYKKAVDAGRRSGGGRLVLTYYELCNDIWSGAPATTSIPGGFDISSISLTTEENIET